MTGILKFCDSLAPTRQAIVEAARRCIGTPFRHQGRDPYNGLDCLGLLIAVARELGLRDRRGAPLDQWDRVDYGNYPDEKALKKRLDDLLIPKSLWEREGEEGMLPGDIALFRIDGAARHLAILGGAAAGGARLTLIHAYAPLHAVVEHRFDTVWRKRVAAIYGLSCNDISSMSQ